MTAVDLFVQQLINGLSLGAMYSLLALGFTLVYGIMELINFSHFNVFMVGCMIAMLTLQAMGLSGQAVILSGAPLVLTLLAGFAVSMVLCGFIGNVKDRGMLALRPVMDAVVQVGWWGVGGLRRENTACGGAQARVHVHVRTHGCGWRWVPSIFSGLCESVGC